MKLYEEISRMKSIMGLIVENNDEPNIQTVKIGVEELFNSIPELSEIGTPEQYSEYLDTIFPGSENKNIWYIKLLTVILFFIVFFCFFIYL